MFKKTLLSLAVASTLGLTGCFDSASDNSNANPSPKYKDSSIDGKTWPVFNPATSQLPLPNDLIFDSKQGDGTFGVADTKPPVTTALNELSGASTVAPAVIQTNGQLDESTVVAGKTVHLIELEYASGDPVRALSNSEPPTLAVALQKPPVSFRADVESLDGQSAIRILPLKPLNPQKRYIVLVTTGVKDINGDSIVQDPVYRNITGTGTAENPNDGLLSSALAPVRSLVNGLWEPVAMKYAAAVGAPVTEEQIALTYSFTTSNDAKVLQYIAEPAAWFADQITAFVRTSAVTAARDAGASEYADLAAAANAAIAQFPQSLPENPASPLNAVFAPTGPCPISGPADLGAGSIDCLSTSLASQFRDALPTPLPGVNRNVFDGTSFTDAITIDNGTIQPVGLLSAVAGSIPGADSVLAVQGSVSLPYYLGDTPAGIAGDNAVNWVADKPLAESLNTTFSALGLSLPQADASVSKAVNYVFPFPKRQSTQEAPMLVLYPNSGEERGVVMYQHGITTDRSAALTFGTALAAQGYVVVAIDQPLHGIAPFTTEEQESLALKLLVAGGATESEAQGLAPLVIGGNEAQLATALGEGTATQETTLKARSLINTVANAGSTIPGLAPDTFERHYGLYATPAGTPAPMEFDPANAAGTDGSGSFFINLQNFLAGRDNIRQSVVDQLNLRATLAGSPAASRAGMTLQKPAAAGGDDGALTIDINDPVYFVGHSLGTITGMPFLSAVNEDQIADTIFTAPDGSSSLPSAFNNIQSASLLTPGGGVVRLLENSPSFAPRILFGLQQAAGLEQGDANLETFFNVFQAAIDSTDPVNFTASLGAGGTPILLSEVAGDNVIPNAADKKQWSIDALSDTFSPAVTGLPVPVSVDSFSAPLAGTKPLTIGLGGDQLTTYQAGDHGTPVSANNDAVFGGMVCETLVTFGVGLAELPAFCTAP
ncbi:hypothetical protein [Marinobacter litoralis]|uniref:hypothetical protein n=1 Tax=Marinobacter litoralis TaxID=187981 RepID=UPI0018EAE9EE|nr:hypothetical protein [Marinobacter litoralis]MBJ6138468.1 hypothetical protein [Marinobacter litoralis]